MSMINTIIPPQSFERILLRIGEILADEIANQFVLTLDLDLNAPVFYERFIPFDKTELPAVNVSLTQGDVGGQIAVQSNGTYRFAIDCHCSAKNTETQMADSAAMVKLQKLLGVCRAILENPKYKTLGFEKPFINRRYAESIAIAKPDPQDSEITVMGRLVLVVIAPETTELIVPTLISGYETNMKLELTEKGYLFTSPEE